MLTHSASLAFLALLLPADASAQQAVPPATPATVRSVVFTGSTSFDDRTLLSQLPLTRVGGEYLSKKLEFDIETNLKAFLKEHGFMTCEVRWKADPGPTGGIDVRIDVSEGAQYRVGKLEFKDVTALAQEQVSALFGLRKGDIVNLKKIKNALDQLKQMYSESGYIDWSFIPEQSLDPAARTMDLLLTMVEGKQFRIGAVGFVGCGDQQEENQLRAVLKLTPGAIFRDSDLKASIVALNQQGRFNTISEADVEVHPDAERGLVAVVFMLKPRV